MCLLFQLTESSVVTSDHLPHETWPISICPGSEQWEHTQRLVLHPLLIRPSVKCPYLPLPLCSGSERGCVHQGQVSSLSQANAHSHSYSHMWKSQRLPSARPSGGDWSTQRKSLVKSSLFVQPDITWCVSTDSADSQRQTVPDPVRVLEEDKWKEERGRTLRRNNSMRDSSFLWQLGCNISYRWEHGGKEQNCAAVNRNMTAWPLGNKADTQFKFNMWVSCL